MDAGRQSWVQRKALDIVVGIEVGVIGGVLMLLLLMLASPLLGQSWWTYPNLFASHYYSRPVVRYGPGLVTLSGTALQVFWAGVLGGLAGFLAPRGKNGVLFAMLWFLGCYFIIWRKYAPGIGLYGSPALLFASFLLYGSVLRFHPRFLARVHGQSDVVDKTPAVLQPEAPSRLDGDPGPAE